jgi:membrane protein YdbS with pleckstrin-like domain
MTTDFTNPPIDVDGLPRISDEQFVPLDGNFLRSKLVGDGIFAVLVVAGTAMVAAGLSQTGGPVWLPLAAGAILFLLIIVVAVLQTVAVNHLGYLVREHDLTFRRGVISRVTQTIPYNRVQHVGIDRGPVERIFGLATLRLRSAGGVIGIEGLAFDDANRLKQLVVARAGTEGEVAHRTMVEPGVDQGDENGRW